MNSRERTALALKHQPADRIPIDFWATPAVFNRLEDELGTSKEGFLDRYDVDLRYIDGPKYIGPPLDEDTDIWGVRRVASAAGNDRRCENYSEVVEPPLQQMNSTEAIEQYSHWPDPDWFDYSVIEKQCDEIRSRDRVVVFQGDRLNRVAQLKPAMYLRGTENIFIDLAMQEEIADITIRKIREFYIVYLDRILHAAKGKIDIVLTGDDFGSQNALLISPITWRRFIRDGFKQYIDLIKRYDCTAMHHTCGSTVGILPDMIECGLDVLQSIQPEASGMALAELKNSFGDKLSFHGGISIQNTMPYGTRDDIRNEVRTLAEIAGNDGGYIFCTSHNIQADTSVENIVALMEAYLEYGKSARY